MKVKQISVFLENRRGRLAAVTRTLADKGINVRAFSVADTSDFGILRLIVDDPQNAHQTLKEQGFTVNMTDVVAVEVPDEPGGLARLLDVVHAAEIDIEYLYAFCEKDADAAMVILRLADFDRGTEALTQAGLCVIPSDRVYGM